MLKLFQIESRLENPTKYHMLESQRKQVKEKPRYRVQLDLVENSPFPAKMVEQIVAGGRFPL